MKKLIVRILRIATYIVAIVGLIRSKSTQEFTMWLVMLGILRNETNLDMLDYKLSILVIQQGANTKKLDDMYKNYKEASK